MSSATATAPLKVFALIAGVHEGPDYTRDPATITDPITGVETRRWFTASARGTTDRRTLVYSPTDLARQFGSDKFLASDRGVPADVQARFDKFQPLVGATSPQPLVQRPRSPTTTPATATSAPATPAVSGASAPTAVATPGRDLESYTVEELRELAAEEEVDLAGARTKADIVARIEGAGR